MEEQITQKPDQDDEQPVTWQRRAWAIARRIVAFAVLFLLMVFLVFQVPAVQTWTARQLAGMLSKTLETQVTVDRLSLLFLNSFSLEEFYIEDLQGDTLLYTGSLEVRLSLRPQDIFRRGLVVQSAALEQARLNWLHRAGAEESNLEEVLGKLFKPREPDQPSRPFQMDLKVLRMNDLRFVKQDDQKGNYLDIALGRGAVFFRRFDLPEKRITASRLVLFDPVVAVETRPAMADTLARDGPSAKSDSSGLHLEVVSFELDNGSFRLDNFRKTPARNAPPGVIDFRHMQVEEIGIRIFDFSLEEQVFAGRIDQITARESNSGFVLRRMEVQRAEVSPQIINLEGVAIQTPGSLVRDTVRLKYRTYKDFSEFVDRVRLDVDLQRARVALKDIIAFAPGLSKNSFFVENREEVLKVEGELRGSVNNLSGRELLIETKDGSAVLQGRFSANNLALRNEEILNLRLENFKSNVRLFKQLFPTSSMPESFYRLGDVQFQGYFQGFFADFVAYGDLRTELGRAEMDMRMNLVPGRENAEYSGALSLQQFDLGGWTGDPDFGTVTLTSRVIGGKGLTEERAQAELKARIENLTYKGYRYENAVMNGELKQNQFDGRLSIQDDNIDLDFEGKVDLTEQLPLFRFAAQVNRLDLKELNLTEQDYVASGKAVLDVRERRLAEMQGDIVLEGVELVKNQREVFRLDSLQLHSDIDQDSIKTISLNGNMVDGEIVGRFDIATIGSVFLDVVAQNFPGFARQLNLQRASKPYKPHQFVYDIHIEDSQGFQELLIPKLGRIREAHLTGFFDSKADSMLVDAELPVFRYDSIRLFNPVLVFNVVNQFGELDLVMDSVQLTPRIKLGPTFLLNFVKGDTLLFGFSTEPLPDSQDNELDETVLDDLNFNGHFFALDSTGFQVEFEDSDLLVFREKWTINPENYIQFGKEFTRIENFTLSNGTQEFKLESVDQKGLRFDLLHLPFSGVEQFWSSPNITFGGQFDLSASVNNLFELSGFSLLMSSPQLSMNDEEVGRVVLSSRADSLSGRLDSELRIAGNGQVIEAKGYFNLGEASPGVEGAPAKPHFDYTLSLTNLPVSVPAQFIRELLTYTYGTVDGEVRIHGTPQKPNIGGQLELNEVEFMIDYLQTRYRIPTARLAINNRLFDASGTVLYDRYGHTAVISGGISHDRLKDFALAASLDANRFLGLNTKDDGENPFYGHALGTGLVRFSGSFKQTNIYINATVGDSTRFVIPVDNSTEESGMDFIRFVNKQEEARQVRQRLNTDLKGLNLDFDLTVTNEAVVEIVFDEQAGDILKGQGRGNLQIGLTRDGLFTMFGDYTIARGEYLFTLYNVVNKKFEIKEGGTIIWSGDPFEAQLNVEAQYSNISTSVSNFIQEYISVASSDIQSEASQPTRINLLMHLRGQLLQPAIDFDIRFPDLRGELLTYCESKMRVLRRDQNELNRQVFGLIVAGQFLPADATLQGSGILFHTMSEFVSNQLSLLLTDLFSEFIRDGRVLSGIDLDIAYSQFQNTSLEDGQSLVTGNEFQVRLRQDFFDDRLSVTLGSNVGVGGNVSTAPGASGAFVGNDVIIEYVLNRDRSLKLKVYQRLQPDIGGGRRLQVGTGLSFRKEFDNFGDFLRSFRRDAKGLSE